MNRLCWFLGIVLVCAAPAAARADIILTAQNLNEALKNMERLKLKASRAAPADRAEAIYLLGLEADALASLMSDEVIAHGDQEQLLLDLGLARTRELGVAIAYSREKRKFFYDGAAFREYVAAAPEGPQAARANFKVIEGEFYQSTGTDANAILEAAARKTSFLSRFPAFELNAEVNLMLAIDYRDLYRIHDEAGDTARRNRYRDLVRRQYRAITRQFPGTEQADAARKLLARFEDQLKTRKPE
jgi:TolA-binding protein